MNVATEVRDLDSSKLEKLIRSAVVAVDAAHMKQLLTPSLAGLPPFHEKINLEPANSVKRSASQTPDAAKKRRRA